MQSNATKTQRASPQTPGRSQQTFRSCKQRKKIKTRRHERRPTSTKTSIRCGKRLKLMEVYDTRWEKEHKQQLDNASAMLYHRTNDKKATNENATHHARARTDPEPTNNNTTEVQDPATPSSCQWAGPGWTFPNTHAHQEPSPTQQWGAWNDTQANRSQPGSFGSSTSSHTTTGKLQQPTPSPTPDFDEEAQENEEEETEEEDSDIRFLIMHSVYGREEILQLHAQHRQVLVDYLRQLQRTYHNSQHALTIPYGQHERYIQQCLKHHDQQPSAHKLLKTSGKLYKKGKKSREEAFDPEDEVDLRFLIMHSDYDTKQILELHLR